MFFTQPVPPNTPITPIIVQVADAPVEEIGVLDILLGSLGITGLLLIGSALLGLGVAAVIVWLRRRRGDAMGSEEGASLGTAQLKLTLPPSRDSR